MIIYSKLVCNQIFDKYQFKNKNILIKIFIFIELLIKHNIYDQEDGYKYMLYFYYLLMKSVTPSIYTKSVLFSLFKIMDSQEIYISQNELILDQSSKLETVLILLYTNNHTIQDLIENNISVLLTNDNTYIISGITCNTIREGLWKLSCILL